MSDRAEMEARHRALLARVQALSLSLAEDLHAAALEAETPAEKAQLATAFHRMGRAVRQSVALEARLVRETERAAREVAAEALALAEAERQLVELKQKARKTFLRDTVRRLIWDEVEDEDDADQMDRAESLLAELETEIGFEAEAEGFLTDPPEAQVRRLCETLGVELLPAEAPAPPSFETPAAAVPSG